MRKPLILLDRDGVINADLPKGVLTIEEFRFLPRALDAMTLLNEAGFAIAICTNQSAIGKGWMEEDAMHIIHSRMQHDIVAHGGRVDAIYFAADHPDMPTLRRKPGPGMLQEALQTFAAEPSQTVFVGDALRDIQAAEAARCPAICVRTGKGEATIAEGFGSTTPPIACCDDLYDAAEYVIAHYAPKALS